MARTETNMKVGTMLIKHLSESFYKKRGAIFDELATNSRDAGATRLTIDVDDKKIMFTDNGEGMDTEELKHFFFLARSSKSGQVNIIGKRGKKRDIIGRFGIGKLSMSQICNRFRIVSWKDGTESYGEFDFGSLKKFDYIEDIKIEIHSKQTNRENSGTEITLYDLTIDAIKEIDNIREGISRTMPIDDDFEVMINGEKVDPFEYKDKQKEYLVTEEVSGLGKVTGRIIFTKRNVKGRNEGGVFVKIKGRVANPESAHEIVDLATLTGAQALARRTVAIFNVDGLEDAQLTNRDGFIKDHERYQKFAVWAKRILNQYASKARASFTVEKRKKIEEESKQESTPIIRKNLEQAARQKFEEAEEKRKTIEDEQERVKANPKEAPEEEQRKVRQKRTVEATHKMAELLMDLSRRLITRYEDLGEESPECIVDIEANTATINRDHPVYRKSAACDWLTLHTHKAIAAALALKVVERESVDGLRPFDKIREYYEIFVRMPIDTEVLEEEQNMAKVQLEEAEEELQELLSRKQKIEG